MSVALEPSSVALVDLRRTRQHKRVANIHWVDALYHVYLAAIFGIVGVVVVSNLVGGTKLGPSGLADVLSKGPALLGIVPALAVLIGLRSGSRGGPIALEGPDVRHVLMSPVNRAFALRGPAIRQLRFVAFVAAATGAVAAVFAHRRLGHNPAALIVCGAVFGLTVGVLGIGCALFASGRRLPSWAASLVGVILVAWGIADAAGKAPTAPGTFLGYLPLWPLQFEWSAIVPVVVALAIVVLGLRGIGGISVEHAERRTNLVGQLRFAVTMQDLRTVLVLRRQLAMELPRVDPWFGVAKRRPRFPVWARGWRGVRRWPATRLVRMVLLAVIAGLAMRAAWAGTIPLIVVAGLAMWIAALDAIETLSQETDHPSRRDAYPMEEGELMVRHLAVPAIIGIGVALVAALVAVAVAPSEQAVKIAAVAFVPGGLLAVVGAVVSTLMGAPKMGESSMMETFAPPEFAGVKNALRTAWPPALAIAGTLPMIMARDLVLKGKPFLGAEAGVSIALVVVFMIAGGWVRYRADIHDWWSNVMAEASQAQKAKAAGAAGSSGSAR